LSPCAGRDRAGGFPDIDADHLAEELEGSGKSERRALCSHMRDLLLRLLEWQFQPGLRGPAWRLSFENARREIQVILEDSPSLEAAAQASLQKEYPSACKQAIIVTGLPDAQFPVSSPYALDPALAED
jgi:hypothetical protein